METGKKTGLIEVAPGIWALILSIIGPEGGGPNAGFIIAGDKTIVIDSLISLGTARELGDGIKKAGGKAPSFLVLTHSHSDHIIGTQVFAPPAIVISQENTRTAVIKDGAMGIKRTAETRPFLAEDLKEAKVIVPDITYQSRMTFHFDKRTVELIHLGPAHSLGDTVVYVPEEKVLFAGDLLFNRVIPPIMGSSAGWVKSLNELLTMDIKTVVPGHGFIGTKESLADMKDFLLLLRREVKKCYDHKVPQDKALSEINLGKYKDWPHPERLTMDIALLYKELSS